VSRGSLHHLLATRPHLKVLRALDRQDFFFILLPLSTAALPLSQGRVRCPLAESASVELCHNFCNIQTESLPPTSLIFPPPHSLQPAKLTKMSAVEPQKIAEVPAAGTVHPAPAPIEPVHIDVPVEQALKTEETKPEGEVAALAEEKKEEKKEEKAEVKPTEPIYSGALGYKAPGLKK
jgi:hypothetical protein